LFENFLNKLTSRYSILLARHVQGTLSESLENTPNMFEPFRRHCCRWLMVTRCETLLSEATKSTFRSCGRGYQATAASLHRVAMRRRYYVVCVAFDSDSNVKACVELEVVPQLLWRGDFIMMWCIHVYVVVFWWVEVGSECFLMWRSNFNVVQTDP